MSSGPTGLIKQQATVLRFFYRLEKGMINKRAHTRYTLNHDALVVTKGVPPASCDVANVCVGGMLLANLDSGKLVSKLAEDKRAKLEVHLFCHTPNGENHLSVMASVCRLDPPLVGIKFTQPQQDLVDFLLQLRSQKKSENGVLYTTKSKRSKLRAWFRQNAEQYVVKLFTSVLVKTKQDLDARIQESADLREISTLRDGKVILSMTPEFVDAFMSLWKAGLDELQAGHVPQTELNNELSLVEKSHFESWLEIQMVATTALNRNREQLFLLNQYLSQIFAIDIDNRWNPIAPAFLGQCLHGAAAKMEIPEEIRPLLHLSFEAAFDVAYGDIIESLFGVFERYGLRALRVDQMRTNWADVALQRHVEGAASLTDEDSEENTENTTLAEGNLLPDADFDALPQATPINDGNLLQMVRLQRQVEAASGAAFSPFEQVSTVPQSRLQPDQISQYNPELLDHLATQSTLQTAVNHSQLAVGLENGLSQYDRDVVDLVDRMFSSVSKRQIPDELKSTVNQLRLPLFKLLLTDQSFIEDTNHAARELLNHFMTLASADRVSVRNLDKLLRQVVEDLTQAKFITTDLLTQLAQRLKKLVKRQDLAFDRSAERIAKTYDGQERLLSARRAVARRLNTIMRGNQVPDVILELLDAGWEHTMVLGLLKEGGDSETVAEYFSILEQLFLWLGPNLEDDVIFERELESPALLEQIQRELGNGTDPAKVHSVLGKLENLLYREEEVTYQSIDAYPLGEALAAPKAKIEHSVDERWQERAHQFQIGDWAEMSTETGIHRMRLVWVDDESFKFVFLTPQGMHEEHLEYADLVSKLNEGAIIPVDGGTVPFVDQSLYTIVEDLYQKMAVQAVHDDLTGCMQRRELEKQLDVTVAKVKQCKGVAGLVVFDIDQFGMVNSRYGNQVGDMVLKKFCLLLDHWLIDYNLDFKLGRTAGNEFTLVVESLNADQAMQIAETVRNKFSDYKFVNQGSSFTATLSCGVVIVDDTSPDASQLLNLGALAYKSAKKMGGNCSKLYSVTDQDQVHHQQVLHWLAKIENNMDDCDLFLRTQRIQPLKNGGDRLPIYETLLGIKDAEGRVVSPAAFIEAGETYNKSVLVDTWVVRNLLQWMRSNLGKVAQIEAFTVNISGLSIIDNSFMEFIEQQFSQGGFPPEKICFEVTETAAVANISYAADFMRELKRNGCRFALDDFGTGFASYAYLQKLPVDFLKVDGVFVQGLHDNMTNYAMVKSICELGHFLGITTIAECAEQKSEVDALQEIGVDYVQGFYVEKPMKLAEL